MADEMIGERDAFEAWWSDWQRGTWDASIDREMPAHWNEDSRSRMELAYQAGRASLAASAGSEPVAWPKDAAEVRAFIGSQFERLQYGKENGVPHENDRYTLTSHDLLSAFRWWSESLPSPQEGMAGWKPIETAPKDGTEILLRSARGRVADGAWGQPDGWANPNCWVWPYINQEPTHWMPLPASEAKEL